MLLLFLSVRQFTFCKMVSMAKCIGMMIIIAILNANFLFSS